MSAPTKPTRLLTALAALLMASCDQELPGDEICRDIGYAIANKWFECTGDVEASNARYEQFIDTHSCKISELPSEDQLLNDRISTPPRDSVGDPYQCSAAILQFTCEKALAIGEDSDQWLSASAQCNAAYSPSGTNPAGGAGGAGGESGASGEAGAAGAAGDAGAAGSGGGPVLDLTIQGEVDGQSFQGICVLQDNVNLSFLCRDSSETGSFVTFKNLTTGAYQGIAAMDPIVRIDPLKSNQFHPTLSPSDQDDGSFLNLTVTDVQPAGTPDRQVSISVDMLVKRISTPTLTITLKGTATGVPCASSCP